MTLIFVLIMFLILYNVRVFAQNNTKIYVEKNIIFTPHFDPLFEMIRF